MECICPVSRRVMLDWFNDLYPPFPYNDEAYIYDIEFFFIECTKDYIKYGIYLPGL